MKIEKKRTLHLESLESRTLLSAIPVTLPSVQSGETETVCCTKTLTDEPVLNIAGFQEENSSTTYDVSESNSSAEPINVELVELATKKDEEGNILKIRQKSITETIPESTNTNTYRFTVDGKSTISADLTTNESAVTFKIQLYEERADGSPGTLLAEADSDTLNVSLQDIRNRSDEAQKFRLVVSASGDEATGSQYTLILTENATSNAQTTTELYGTNSAVGHVSMSISGFTDAGKYNLLDSQYFGRYVIYEDYTLVGNSDTNEVWIFQQNEGTKLVGTITVDGLVTGDGFGSVLVRSGDTLVVSAPSHVNANNKTGTVYLFDLKNLSTTGTCSLSATICNQGSSKDFGSVMDYSEELRLLVVGSITNGPIYWIALNEDATKYQAYNLTTTLSSSLNDGSLLGYSVSIDDSGFVAIGAPSATEYAGQTGYHGVVFVLFSRNVDGFARPDGSKSLVLPETTDYCFGYSVACENGILVVGAVPDTTGIALHTFEIANNSTDDNKVVCSDLYISGQEDLPPQGVQFRDGILFVTGMSVSSPDTQLTLCSQSVWPYNIQTDSYHFTANDSTVKASFSMLSGSSVENLKVVLLDSEGTEVKKTISEGTITYSVTNGKEYSLRVDENKNGQCDYVLTLDGIVQKDYTFGMTNLQVNGKGVSETLTACPNTVTLELGKAVRSDLLSNASVQINGVSASSFELSEDGKTVTFTFAHKQFTETSATLTIQAEDFCTLDGSVLELEQSEYTLEFTQATATQKISARKNSTQAIWTFSENLAEGAASSAQVSVKKNSQDITSHGTLTVDGKQLIWTAEAEYTAETDDLMTISMNASTIQTESGIPVQKLEEKTYKINLNVQGKTELVVRKTSSLDEEGGASRSEIPANEKWVDEWQNIWVEVWASVLSDTQNGLRTYSAEISYNPEIFCPFKKTQDFTWKFDSNIFSSVKVEVAGENKLKIEATVKSDIQNAGACNLAGEGTRLLLGSIQFYGQKDSVHISDTWEIKGSAIGIKIVENSVTMEDSLETKIESIENTTENLPPVYPVVYDLNDSGSTDIDDLVIFAKVYYQSAEQSPIARVADFNASGKVDIDDLVLFAKNYNKTVGNSVTYDPKLTENWGNQEALEDSVAQVIIVPSTDARSELEAAWEELREEEVDELDAILDEMIL